MLFFEKSHSDQMLSFYCEVKISSKKAFDSIGAECVKTSLAKFAFNFGALLLTGMDHRVSPSISIIICRRKEKKIVKKKRIRLFRNVCLQKHWLL